MQRDLWNISWLAAFALLGGCTQLADGSFKASETTKQLVDHTRHSWEDVFEYRPRKPPQGPQTRYCYNTLTDSVCYDSVQPALTSRLNGYQDGAQISWVQPGGGSLGASGGGAVALAEVPSSSVVEPPSDISVSTVTPVAVVEPPVSAVTTEKSPFHRKESPYVKAK